MRDVASHRTLPLVSDKDLLNRGDGAVSDYWTNARSWLAWLLRGVVVVAVLLNVERVAEEFASVAFDQPAILRATGGLFQDSLGSQVSFDSSGKLGWRHVEHVVPGGPAEAAGLQTGDSMRFDQPLGGYIVWYPGEQIPVTIEREGKRFRTTIVAQQPTERRSVTRNFILARAVDDLVLTGLALLLLIRGRRNRAAILLGIFELGVTDPLWLAWLPHWLFVPLNLLVWAPTRGIMGYCWPAFALEISGGAASARQARFVNAIAVALGIALFALALQEFFAVPVSGSRQFLWMGFAFLHMASGFAIMAWNYRRANPVTRNRIKIIFPAFVLLFFAVQFTGSTSIGSDPVTLMWLAYGSSLVSLALLVYAVLRQRLFDMGFAINRTLVYGAVTFTMLATFGLAEWGVDHVIPESWHEGSMAISAAIAVGLFLSFHRLREWFEHQIERLFFSEWQRAEAGLKRFVENAGHFDRIEVLCKSFADALGHFTGGARVALYLRESGGNYRRQTGSLAGSADYTDDPAFALMRGERRPIELSQTGGNLPGALALPMLDQGVLTGFVLLDGKPDGSHYRPDEIENLGWAAHQVGLDLQALHARELERQNHDLQHEISLLREIQDRLTANVVKANQA